MLFRDLDHVGLRVTDPRAAADFCRRALSLPVSEANGTLCAGVGATRLKLMPSGPFAPRGEERTGVHHIAFRVADLAEATSRFREVGVTVHDASPGDDDHRPSAWLDPLWTNGVLVQMVEDKSPVQRANSELIQRIDHLGIASGDNVSARQIFCDKLNLPYESSQTDSETVVPVESFVSDRYGVVYHTRPPEQAAALRVLFITAGDLELEFLQEMVVSQGMEGLGSRAGSTKQDRGAIGGFVAKRGPGLHHIAFKVPDIDAALARVREHGVQTIDLIGRPGSRRARIGFMHPRSTFGVLMHFVERPEVQA